MKAHCYEVHTCFKHLLSPSVASRLQLAALHAATATLLPELGSQRTGAQRAIELGAC